VLAAVSEGVIGPLQGRLGYQEAGEMAKLECENVISIGFTHLITSFTFASAGTPATFSSSPSTTPRNRYLSRGRGGDVGKSAP
jgi:hypothetical protein